MAVAHLLNRHLRSHRTRAILTVLAIAVAISLVTALTSAFASLRGAAYGVLGTMYGTTDVVIEPDQQRGTLLDGTWVDSLRSDRRIRQLTARLVTRSQLLDENDKIVRSRPAQIVGLSPDDATASPVSTMLRGQWFDSERGNVIVIDEHIAERYETQLGQTLSLPSPSGPMRLKVIGVLGRPDAVRLQPPTIYMPIQTLQERLEQPGQYSELRIDLADGVDADAFAQQIQKEAAPASLAIETATSRQENFDRNFQGLTLMSYLGGTLSMLAAVFIVFSALTMGVTERSRSLGMLRAIGATRGQIAGLVIGEGAALAVLGALIGVPLGLGWVALLSWLYPKLFISGLIISSGGIVYGALGTLAAALIAAALPAWTASRADLLEALTITTRPHTNRSTILCGVAGLILLAIDPLIVFSPGLSRTVRMFSHLFIGLPTLLIGLVGVTPLLIVTMDRLLSLVVARLSGIEPTLMRQQLTGGLWRTTGTAAGLMVGLFALVVLQTHGRSMATGWTLPTKFPDMLLIAPMGLNMQQIEKLQTVDQIASPGVLPMAMVTPELAGNLFGLGGLVKMPEGTILFGLDIDRAFGRDGDSSDAMIELDFIEGDADSVRRKLKQGRHVIVSDHFRRAKGMGVGDTLAMNTPSAGEVEYTIAGVVRSVGIDMIVRLFEMKREFDRWTAAGAITTLDDVERDFGAQRIYLMAANVDDKLPREMMVDILRDHLGTWGVFAADAREVKRGIDEALGKLLDLISTIALAAIAVAALGVTNTIIASVRSRRWQMGVLRSLGLTRGELLRLVLAEAVMIGGVATVLGIAGGMLLSVSANHLTSKIVGYVVPLVIPWSVLLFGAAVTVSVAALAALRPAWTTAATDTLTLLKAGRAAD